MFLFSLFAIDDTQLRVPKKMLDLLLKEKSKFYFAKIQVQFDNQSSTRSQLNEGGGVFDLATLKLFKQNDQQKIKFEFIIDPQINRDTLTVFFIPLYQPIQMPGFSIGAACGFIYDLSSNFSARGGFMKHPIYIMSHLPARDVIISGDWIFSYQISGDTFIAIIRIYNSESQLTTCL